MAFYKQGKIVAKDCTLKSAAYVCWNTSSYLNAERKKHWARMVLGWESAREFLLLLAWVWILIRVECFNPAPPIVKLQSIGVLLR